MVNHKPVPDDRHDHCANGRADKTRALIELIPADELANKGCNKCADDSENSCENKARRPIRPRRHKARDEAGNEPNHNDPDIFDTTATSFSERWA